MTDKPNPKRETLSSILAEYTPTHAPKGRAEGDGLLPCPFCGCAAAARMYSDDMLFRVDCSGCTANVSGFDQCKQDAIDAWNARVPTRDGAEGDDPPIAWEMLNAELAITKDRDVAEGWQRAGLKVRPLYARAIQIRFTAESAPPKPAPDAMREALKAARLHIGDWLDSLSRARLLEQVDAALSSAPVPAPDGLPIGEDTPYWRTLRAALVLPVEEQHAIAKDLAANCGYELTGDAYTRPSPAVAAEPVAQMLDHARRLGDIAIIVEDGGMPGYAADLRKIAQQLFATPPVRGDREAIAEYRRHWWSFFHGWHRTATEADEALETAERAKLFDPAVHRALSLPVQPNLPLGKSPAELIWNEVLEYQAFKNRLSDDYLPFTELDQEAFAAIAQPYFERLAVVQSSAGERGSDAAEADRYFEMAGEFGNQLQNLAGVVHDAIDLLAERKHGNAARSPGHNARVILETALKRVSPSALPVRQAPHSSRETES